MCSSIRSGEFVALVLALAGCTSPLTAGAPAWRRVASTGPEARWGQAAVYDPALQRMLVFGGQTEHDASSELWAFDLATEHWHLLSTSPGPSPRVNPAVVLDRFRNRLVVTGGRTGAATLFDDAWSLDLATLSWRQLPIGPGPRQRAHPATDGAHAWFYGGEGLLSVFGDLWEFDLANETWRLLPSDGDGPGARTCGAFAFDRGGLVMVGGHDVTTPRDGSFRYDLTAQRWSRLATSGSTAAGAHWAYAADDACHRLYLAGGDHLDNYDTALTDALTLDTNRFDRLPVSALPPVHDHASLIVDDARHELVLYGGTIGDGQGYLGDAWIYPLPDCP